MINLLIRVMIQGLVYDYIVKELKGFIPKDLTLRKIAVMYKAEMPEYIQSTISLRTFIVVLSIIGSTIAYDLSNRAIKTAFKNI